MNSTVALKARIPKNSYNFNGLGHILPDIGLTAPNFQGYRNILRFLTRY